MTGILLSLVLAGPFGVPEASAIPPSVPVSAAQDPFGSIALADRLITSGRNDEALAVLRSALDEPVLERAASERLAALLLASPPRAAWRLAYNSVIERGIHVDAVRQKAALAALEDPSAGTRAAAARALQKLLDAAPTDERARLAAGDAWMSTGRYDKALVVYARGTGDKSRSRQVAALLAMGRMDRALRVDAMAVPDSCRIAKTPVACAMGLAELGFLRPAADRLSRDIAARASGVRSRADKASALATLGQLQARDGRTDAAIGSWRRSLALVDTRIVRRHIVEALLEEGRGVAARKYVDMDDPCIDAGSCLPRTAKAVLLAQSVDPTQKSAKVDSAMREAFRLDAKHPIVARQYAVWQLTRGEDAAAWSALAPLLTERADDDGFLAIYAWAALRTQRPEAAVEGYRVGMAAAQSPQTFASRLVKYAEYQVPAAEKDKTRLRHDLAHERYLLSLTPNPRDAGRLQGLGGALWGAEQFMTAEAAYRRAWALDPRDADALTALVNLLQNRKAYDEAMLLLATSSTLDGDLQSLEQQVQSAIRSRDVERLRDEGRPEEALRLLDPMVADTPTDVRLLKLRADLLSMTQRYVEAAETYALARSMDPVGNPWLVLGEVNALLALQQPEEARALLDTLPLSGPAEVDIRRASRAVHRAEAARLVAAGKDVEALVLYQVVLEEAPDDSYTAAGLAELYASRGQLGPAIAWMDQAVAGRPTDASLRRRRIGILLQAGQLRRAQAEAGSLVASHPTPTNLALARSVERQMAVERAAEAVATGDMLLARRLLQDQRAAYPEDTELVVIWAQLQHSAGESDDAWHLLTGVLEEEPAHPLALTTLATVGLETERAPDVLAAWRRAAAEGGPSWVASELVLLELAARLDEGRERYSRGMRASADEVVAEAERWYGTGDARRQVLIGGGWMDVGRPERAVSAYELARLDDPSGADPTVGLASALEAIGEAGAAEQVLTDHWSKYQEPAVGAALVDLQARHGRPAQAQQTLAALRAREADPSSRRIGATDTDLQVLALPDGTMPEDDIGPAARPDFAPSASSKVGGAADRPTLSLRAGVGYAGRPGRAGEQYLQAIILPVAVEVAPAGALRLQGEIVPVRLSNGSDVDEAGTSGNVAALVEAGGLDAELRIGSSPSGFTLSDPYLVWRGALGGKLADGVSAGIEVARVPVTDTLTSWAGSRTADGEIIGGVRDTWIGGELGWGGDDGQALGLVARAGHADGLGVMPDVPWRQGFAYGRHPLEHTESRELWLAGNAIVLEHDVQVDGFEAGRGGMFSPELFWAALGHVQAIWGLAPGSTWAACLSAGAGPQQVQGEPTLYLGPGTYVGYALQGAAKAKIGEGLTLVGLADHQGTFGAWSQTAGHVQLRFGRPDDGFVTPTTMIGSPVHGPPLSSAGTCGASFGGWAP
jgi:tetratricopeptide (TPR) repeat protein